MALSADAAAQDMALTMKVLRKLGRLDLVNGYEQAAFKQQKTELEVAPAFQLMPPASGKRTKVVEHGVFQAASILMDISMQQQTHS